MYILLHFKEASRHLSTIGVHVLQPDTVRALWMTAWVRDILLPPGLLIQLLHVSVFLSYCYQMNLYPFNVRSFLLLDRSLRGEIEL